MADALTGDRILSGAGWMILFKLVDRLLGLVSTLILARLLVPADFGLVALATSMIAMLEVLGAFGFDTALIQRTDASRAHFDTVWTFNVLFGVGLALVLVALASPAAAVYGEPRLVGVLIVLAASKAIAGLESVGVIAFRKDLDFNKEFRFRIAKRLLTTLIVTIPLAVVFRNYWALLAGNLAGTCIAVALSYVMHPYRPRLSLVALREMMHFSGWIFFTSLVEFLALRMGDLVVARWAGPAALGTLALARTVANLPTRELVAPIHRALFPAYAMLAGERDRLRAAYLKVISVLLLLIMPAGIGLSLLAEPAVLVLLGRKWTAAIPVVQILAVNGVLSSMMTTAHHVNLAVGMARSTSFALAAYAALAIPLMLVLVPDHGAAGAAAAALIAAVVTGPFELFLLTKAIKFGLRDLVAAIWRPCTGTLVMSVSILVIRAHAAFPASTIDQIVYLFCIASTGAIIYSVTVFLLWRSTGDSKSAEAWLIELALRFFVQLGQRIRLRSRFI